MAKKPIKDVDAHVGRLVRERRNTIGMSLQALGSAIGVAFQQIQKYEKGTNRIGSSRLMQIANVLGVPPTAFFVGAPSANKISAGEQKSMDYIANFVASKDGISLMKAFARLPKNVQHSIVNLVEKIAENE